MIILTNCLTEKTDEGCLKVIARLTASIRAQDPDATVVSCGAEAGLCDQHFPSNKLLLNAKLLRYLRGQEVLYLPTTTRMLPAAARIAVLRLLAGCRLNAVFAMQQRLDRLSKLLLKISGAYLTAMSDEAYRAFYNLVGKRAMHLKTGVDTEKFAPADAEKKAVLRQKYGLPEGKIIVLHVGHMRAGRNVEQLLKLPDDMHGVLVISSYYSQDRDEKLHAQLKNQQNLTVIDTFLPAIEEIYQLADVYLFPVEEAYNCIDTPLSALEAAACNVPVAATPFGELKALLGKPGFYAVQSFEKEALADALRKAAHAEGGRESVLCYDWNRAAGQLLKGAWGKGNV